MNTDKSKVVADGKLKNGIITEHFKDGAICSVGKYVDGKRSGEWKYCFKSGRLKAVGKYLVVHFTNNVVVSRFLGLRQQKLPKNAATHVLASPSDPVE